LRKTKEINRYESEYYINGAVAQSDNYVVYGGCDGWFRIIDCISGVQTDSMQVEAYIPASLAISGDWCYVADYAENIYGIKLEKGKIVSSKKIIESQDKSRTFVSVPAVSDKMVYIVSDDRNIYTINSTGIERSRNKDGSTAWKYLLKGNVGESFPVVCKDKLLACTKPE